MYKLEVDHYNKVVCIELAGYLDKSEVADFADELLSLLRHFKTKEYSMYANMERLDPISQDSIPYMTEVIRQALLTLHMIVSVHRRTVTQMQMRRIEAEAKLRYDIDNNILYFATRREALYYLRSKI
jgi:hypothetical protein